MYLPKHHRGPLQIYYAAMYMFGLESDELVTKGKHRLPSTLTRSAQFGENIGAGGEELQINHRTDSPEFRFEVTFFQTVDLIQEIGLVSSVNMVWSCCNNGGEEINRPANKYSHIISFSLTKKLCIQEFKPQICVFFRLRNADNVEVLQHLQDW